MFTKSFDVIPDLPASISFFLSGARIQWQGRRHIHPVGGPKPLRMLMLSDFSRKRVSRCTGVITTTTVSVGSCA